MAGIFEAITSFFETVWAIVNLVITLILALFQYIFTALTLLFDVVTFVPIAISAPLVIVIVVSVVFKMVGRNSSADN